MSLQLWEDVGGVTVGLVLSQLELLLHPQQQLICIPLKLLHHKTFRKLYDLSVLQQTQVVFSINSVKLVYKLYINDPHAMITCHTWYFMEASSRFLLCLLLSFTLMLAF